jgi:hypothetical protein
VVEWVAVLGLLKAIDALLGGATATRCRARQAVTAIRNAATSAVGRPTTDRASEVARPLVISTIGLRCTWWRRGRARARFELIASASMKNVLEAETRRVTSYFMLRSMTNVLEAGNQAHKRRTSC